MIELGRGWKRNLVYSVFGAFAFILGLYLTFPYEALRERIRVAADDAGFYVKLGSIGPGFFGIRAKRVEVAPKIAAGSDEQPEALMIDTLSIRPALFPPGIALSAKLMGGSVSASVGTLGDLSVNVWVDELDPSLGNFKAFTGVDLAGTISGKLTMKLPLSQPPGQKTKEPDLGAATGSISLDGKGLMVNGGTVTVPMMGEPTPMDLPKIAFGELNGRLVFDKGAGTLEAFDTKSEDVEIQGEGTLKLAKRLAYSEPRLKVKLKADSAFVKRLGLIGMGISALPADPQDPTFRVASISGFLNRPNFVPGAR